MRPPDLAEVFEMTTSKYWFEDGVLYLVTTKVPHPSFELAKAETQSFKKRFKGKKMCAVMDVTDASPSSKEVRDYNTKELPEMFKAIAFITRTALGKMLANLYLGIKPVPFPVKIFSNEEEAKKWIAQFNKSDQ
ncbi:MAG TPA: hypothetical protein VGC65_11015 [Bacteroidia bacterium]